MEKNLDKIINKVGNNGKYQKCLLLIVFMFWLTVDFISVSIPYLEVNRVIKIYDSYSKSFINQTLNYTLCDKENFYKNKTVELSGHSWTIEFDIECDQYLVGLIGSLIFTGVLIGSFLFQAVPDILGRKKTIIISSSLFSLSLVLYCFIKNLKFVYINLVFSQIFSSVCLLTTFMMTLEIVSIDHRSYYGAVINSAFSICGMFFISLYKILNDWRANFFIAALCSSIVMVVYCFYAIESPRFYAYKHDYVNTYKSLIKIAKENGQEKSFEAYLNSAENIDFQALKPDNFKKTDEPYIQLAKLEDIATDTDTCNNDQLAMATEKEKEILIKNINEKQPQYETINNEKDILKKADKPSASASYWDLITHRNLRNRFLIACYLWFSTSGIYYGLSINIKNLPGDIYTNGIFIYFAEIFSYIVSGWIIETFLGRKYSMIAFETLSLFGYMFIYLFHITSYWQTIISFIARFSISAVYNIIYTYSIEIYPTTLRAKGFGSNSLCARIGGIIFPLFIEFFAEHVTIFFLTLNLLAIILIIFLPETLGKSLKDEIDADDD